jgi:hypothetical protein
MEPHSDALLASLSRSIRPAMSLQSLGVVEPITETLATFAVRRHRVGPLLHLACQGCADIAADETALSILKSSYRKNLLESLRQQAVEKKLSDLLISHSVPFSFLKGRGLAEQLHDDPTARRSNDVDILVPPDCSRRVIGLLKQHGYIYKSYTLRRKKMFELMRQDMDMKLFKDLTFIDPTFLVPIELHTRLFTFEPKTLTTDFNDSVKFSANPSLSNSFYCLYLILHGANSLWPRLKWVIDLSILTRRMPLQSRLEMMDIAKSYNCEMAVAASLLMTEEIFPGSLDDDWQILLDSYLKDERVYHMKDLFYETLTASESARPTKSIKEFILSGNADFIFPGKIGLLKSLFMRFMRSLVIRI